MLLILPRNAAALLERLNRQKMSEFGIIEDFVDQFALWQTADPRQRDSAGSLIETKLQPKANFVIVDHSLNLPVRRRLGPPSRVVELGFSGST